MAEMSMNMAIHGAFRRDLTRFFAWVSEGASPSEMAAIKREVPGPVFAIIGGVFGRGYRKSIAPIWHG